MMRIIFLRWKSILKLMLLWIVVTFLTYISWGIGSSSSSHQVAALEKVGKLLTSHDHHPIPEDEINVIEDDADLRNWHVASKVVASRTPKIVDHIKNINLLRQKGYSSRRHKLISKPTKSAKSTIQAVVWDKPDKLIAGPTTKTVLFSNANLTLEQKLQIQYLTGETHMTEREAEDYGIHRSDEFCNPSSKIGAGEEGRVAERFELVNVHVITRHGARSPIFSLPNHEREPMDCHFKSVKDSDPLAQLFYTAMMNLTATIRLQRKQQRMPFLPLHANCEGAQLTGQGALQHLKLGQYLKNVYRKKLFPDFKGTVGFEEVQIRSTEYTRTFQSAMALLYGFFDTVNIVKYHWEFSKFYNFCSTSLSHLPCSCALAHKLQTTLQKEYHKRAENKTLHTVIKQEVGQILQTPAGKVPFVAAVLDVLLGKYCSANNTVEDTAAPPLSCSTNNDVKRCFTWSNVQRLWSYLDGSGQQEVSSSTSSKYSRLIMHPLLHEIATRYQNITHGISDNKFILYSGHDRTLVPLLQTLGIAADGKHPPFASRLILELYRNRNPGGGHFIRVVYNGQDRTRLLRFCEREELVDGLCPLHLFLHYVYHRDMQFFGKNSYVDVCAL